MLYELTEFSFGMFNETNSTGSFMSILNSEESMYGSFANTTFITADFRGIGLPTTSYNQFTNLMDIISAGQALCANVQGGYCVLPKACSVYPNLWQYSFNI
jgi:hypothetical protein